MIYTVRFAHLASKPNLSLGSIVNRSDIIGLMGNSGASTAAHLHIDLVEGYQAGLYTQHDIENHRPMMGPPRQLLYFIDKELFDIEPLITTYFADPDYFNTYKKVHFGFDLVPTDRHASTNHYAIHWPRSMPGKVCNIDNDEKGYGNFVCISFEA